ncbi:conserved hypothetical protein [Clostridium botulinum C str. Eklund]|nr:conserved hypothetical protein [Clostridium botulinum C str. Eklund]NEZ48435.1 hypothetical protein [Clostridium botulinum]
MKIINVLTIVLLIIVVISFFKFRKAIIQQKNKKTMYEHMYYVMNTWIKIKNYGLTICDFCDKHNIKSVAIYAVGEVGSRIYEELEKSNIEVKYFTDKKFIDNDSYMEYNGIPIVNINNYKDKNEVDAIIVSTTFYMDDITEMLKKMGVIKPIISLEEVVSKLHDSIENKK